MPKKAFFQILKGYLFVCGLLPVFSLAQVYSPKAKEVKLSFEATFITTSTESATRLANFHFNHLFGLLKSERFVEEYGLDYDKIQGLGAPLMPADITVTEKIQFSSHRQITYKATAVALIHNRLANDLLNKTYWSVTMPYDLDVYFDANCTDEHYNTLEDFWYFYDPYRQGCEHLAVLPLAKEVTVYVKPHTRRQLDMDARLDLLRGANGNGNLFRIDIVTGFSDSSRLEDDEGRWAFEEVNQWLEDHGFQVKALREHPQRPLYLFTQTLTLDNKKTIEVEVRHLLANTDASADTITFPLFFKDAVENADVFIYAGHSGLGSNLDIDLLQDKSGGFSFNSDKRQIFFFDSCSSYSYYMTPFREQKSRRKLDIITQALVSYYEMGPLVIESFLDVLFDPSTETVTWDYILEQMEEPLEGGSYLINVGGI